jgi:hypothetical protein
MRLRQLPWMTAGVDVSSKGDEARQVVLNRKKKFIKEKLLMFWTLRNGRKTIFL